MKKIDKLSEKYNRVHLLSKSTYLKGKQCVKMLYLNKHKKKEQKSLSKQTQVILTFGKNFENDFRLKFENGFHLEEKLGKQFHLYAGLTEELIQNNEKITLFEAGFIYDDVLVLTDVLQQNENGSYTIYEIKLSNKLKPVILADLALQYYVLKNNLKDIESFNIVMKTKSGKTKILNAIPLIEDQLADIEIDIKQFKKVVSNQEEPDVKIGKHCFRPYHCVFKEYCSKEK